VTRTRVAVAMGGTSAERDVSIRSGEAVLEALGRPIESAGARFDALELVVEADGRWRLGDGEPKPAEEVATELRRRADVVFLALHGPGGEDGAIQGFLETIGLPYTGPGVSSSAIAIDKVATRALLAAAGARVAPAVVVREPEWRTEPESCFERISALGRPVFVKPPAQGSSYGVTRVETDGPAELGAAIDGALRFDSRVLVERGIEGTEATAAVLGNASEPELLVLPPVEIRPRSGTYFDYEEKYSEGGAIELCPPETIPLESVQELQRLALLAHRTLGCDGMSRTDAIVSRDGPVLLEVNTIPGLTSRSLLPRAAAAAGISFPELVARIVDLALRRFRP